MCAALSTLNMKPDIDPESIEMKEIVKIKDFLDENFIYTKDYSELYPLMNNQLALLPFVIAITAVGYFAIGYNQSIEIMIMSFIFFMFVLYDKNRFNKKRSVTNKKIDIYINILKEKYNCDYRESGYIKGNIHSIKTNKILHFHNGYFVKY